MPLDIPSLQTAIKAAFKKAKDTPPPSKPSEADQVQEQILTDLSLDLANAVNTFVRSGDVGQVTVEVRNNANVVIGAGIQNNVGKIQ